MSSIPVGDFKELLEECPDDYEVIMEIRHKYTIPKSMGEKGWIAQINGIHVDDDKREIRLMN